MNHFFILNVSILITTATIAQSAIPVFNPYVEFFEQLKNSSLWHSEMPLRLHLGCGESHLDGYMNIDYPMAEHTVQTKSGADIFADITTLTIPNESIDEVRSHHVFEHFDRQTALVLLCKWHQQLKIDGTLVIETPDFEGSIKLLLYDSVLSYTEKQVIMRHIFGSHEARWAIHCDGWYQEKFMHILSLLGFENITVQHSRYLNLCNITVTAKKTKRLDMHYLINTAKEILKESLVAECETTMYQVWCQQLSSLLNEQ